MTPRATRRSRRLESQSRRDQFHAVRLYFFIHLASHIDELADVSPATWYKLRHAIMTPPGSRLDAPVYAIGDNIPDALITAINKGLITRAPGVRLQRVAPDHKARVDAYIARTAAALDRMHQEPPCRG